RDWSSDVCSSDLYLALGAQRAGVPAVLPALALAAQFEAQVQAFRARVATGGGESQLAGAGPARGRLRRGGVLADAPGKGGQGRGGKQQGQHPGTADTPGVA